MEPVLQFVAALVDVAMDVPKAEIDECCTENTSENKGDYEISRCHDLSLPISHRAKSQLTTSQQRNNAGKAKQRRTKTRLCILPIIPNTVVQN